MSDRMTRYVVATVMGSGCVWAAFALTGPRWGGVLTALLVYEGWTLANAHKHDTISDVVRAFSRKQLLTPWLFGFAFGIGIASGFVRDPYVIAAVALLQGHFFFTLNEQREEAIKQEAKAEAKQEIREAKAEVRADQASGL